LDILPTTVGLKKFHFSQFRIQSIRRYIIEFFTIIPGISILNNFVMNKYSILKADIKKDKKVLLDLYLRNNMQNMDKTIFNWRYERSGSNEPDIWIIKENTNQKIIGAGSLIPKTFFIRGRKINVASARDLVIDKKHRTILPAKILQETIINKYQDLGYKFIIGIPNEKAYPLFLKLGYKEIGEFKQFVKITNLTCVPQDKLPSILGMKFIQAILNFGSKLLAKENYYRKNTSYNVELLNNFDIRFNVLFNKVSGNYPIIGNKRLHILKQKNYNSPLFKYQIFCITRKNELLGYIIFFNTDNLCQITNMLCINDKNIYEALIAEFIKFTKNNKKGAIIFHYFGNESYIDILKKYNFFNTDNNMKMMIYKDNFQDDKSLINSNNWYFCIDDR